MINKSYHIVLKPVS